MATAPKLHHVEMLDIDDSGILTEVVIVQRKADGSVYYINTEVLHPLDKSRLKRILTSQHADKYECWDLLSQSRLNNGLNALDYFHNNFVKVKRAPGSIDERSGLGSVSGKGSDAIIGSEFSAPDQATVSERAVGGNGRGL